MMPEKKKSQFLICIENCKTCDVCGEPVIAIYGGGWDYDRIECTARGCWTETVFPTSTYSPGQEEEEKCKDTL